MHLVIIDHHVTRYVALTGISKTGTEVLTMVVMMVDILALLNFSNLGKLGVVTSGDA